MAWKIFVLIALTAVWLYDVLIAALSRRGAKTPVPENVRDVYDPESYARWKSYRAEKTKVGLVRTTVSFTVTFLTFN